MNNFDPHLFPGQSRKVAYVYWFWVPSTLLWSTGWPPVMRFQRTDVFKVHVLSLAFCTKKKPGQQVSTGFPPF